KINDRQKETITNFDIATNLELGKFFPEKSGIRIPMHFDYSETRSNPQYNPLDPDILVKDELKGMTKHERDSLKNRIQDFTMRKNINFMNVRKEKVGTSKKNHIYDIENFDVSYAYSETFNRDIDVEYNIQKTYRGGLGYNFINQPKIVKPLDKIKILTKYKAFQILKDFNFYYSPKLFSFRTEMNRQYSELKYRNKSDALVIIEPSYVKDWDWTRTYDFKYDFSQGLKMEYHASASAYIDEPAGRIDKHDVDYKAKRDSIIDEILGFGTLQNFNQTSSVSYNIPINKLPLLNWVTLTTQYRSTYTWQASAISLQERLGNTIENSNTKQLNGAFKLTGIYSMIPFLKNLDDGKSKQPKGPGAPNLKSMKPKKAVNDTIEEIKPKVNYAKIISKTVLGILTGFKDVSFSYSENNGTLLPGFTPKPNAIGNRLNDMAPGLGFVFGSQKDIRYTAADNGWLSMDSLLNNAMYVKKSKNLTIKGTIEPIPDFRIDLNADRTENLNHQEYFLYSQEDGRFIPKSPVDNGSFTISYNIWGTAFEKDSKDNKSAAFEKLKSNRLEIATRLARQNPNWNQQYDSTGFPVGYGSKSQDVLLASFLSAYSGKSASSASINPFPKIPKPNWRITYNGLTKIDFLSQYLKNITLSHSYRSTYSLSSYQSNILYHQTNGYADSVDAYNNFRSKYTISSVSITEQFSPLIGFDLTWVNN
ncbi:MAG TPA: cell surface protein SprA, partial [Bacteroidales bacterium]|nr:cell surface protein SprA [Bacteroidales bacterium]